MFKYGFMIGDLFVANDATWKNNVCLIQLCMLIFWLVAANTSSPAVMALKWK